MKSTTIIFKSGITLVVSLLFFVSVSLAQQELRVGSWEGNLKLNDSIQLPVPFEFKKNINLYAIIFHNAEEQIETSELKIVKDSLFIQMPVFDSEFKLKLTGDSIINGIWINHARKDKNVIPFSARCLPREIRQNTNLLICPSITGKWEVSFSPNTKDATKAVGVFKESKYHNLTGTFLTETGDYRFLSGNSCRKFTLSCFDGSHAFLFNGTINGDSIVNGHFYSGAHWHEQWVAIRNDKFELRNPDSLTYLKPGFTKVDFSFKNTEGKNVSLSDAKFKDKVVLIQLMGTWCPNCMDETKFLAPFYTTYNKKGLEIVALAFERTDDFTKAVSNINRSKTRFNASYEFLITMKTGKEQASEALPMLNAVMAFPTTIYIDKKGNVRKIYTGFSGPATGDAYTKYVEETTRFVEKLLAE